MTDKIQRACIVLFSGVFALIWLAVMAVCAADLKQSRQICTLAGLLGLLLLLVLLSAKKLLGSRWEKESFFTGLTAGIFVLMAAGLLYAAFELEVYPGWDFGSVYQGAVELAEDGCFSDNSSWYFTTYPNNVAVCMFLAGIFKLLGGFCSYITLGILLNVGLILLGLFFFWQLARRLYGVRYGAFGMLLCLFFLPFYMHTPIFYTDTFALPFVTGALWSYQFREKDRRFLLLTGVILAAGYKIKGSLGVIFIALLIHLWLYRDSLKERLIRSLLLTLPFLALVGFLTVVPAKFSGLSAEESYRNEFPMEHWVALGLVDSGGYNADVYWMTASTEGKAEKEAVDRLFIRQKLEEYGASGMLAHLREKVVFTWGDGVYFAPEKLQRDPLKESWLHDWVLYYGKNYSYTYRYCNAVQLLLLGGILLSLLRNFMEKGRTRKIQAMQLSVFGIFLFLLIWETRSRYLVNFVPVFILLGLDAMQAIRNRLLQRGVRIRLVK